MADSGDAVPPEAPADAGADASSTPPQPPNPFPGKSRSSCRSVAPSTTRARLPEDAHQHGHDNAAFIGCRWPCPNATHQALRKARARHRLRYCHVVRLRGARERARTVRSSWLALRQTWPACPSPAPRSPQRQRALIPRRLRFRVPAPCAGARGTVVSSHRIAFVARACSQVGPQSDLEDQKGGAGAGGAITVHDPVKQGDGIKSYISYKVPFLPRARRSVSEADRRQRGVWGPTPATTCGGGTRTRAPHRRTVDRAAAPPRLVPCLVTGEPRRAVGSAAVLGFRVATGAAHGAAPGLHRAAPPREEADRPLRPRVHRGPLRSHPASLVRGAASCARPCVTLPCACPCLALSSQVRRRYLQRFLVRISQHPALEPSPDFRDFMRASEQARPSASALCPRSRRRAARALCCAAKGGCRRTWPLCCSAASPAAPTGLAGVQGAGLRRRSRLHAVVRLTRPPPPPPPAAAAGCPATAADADATPCTALPRTARGIVLSGSGRR